MHVARYPHSGEDILKLLPSFQENGNFGQDKQDLQDTIQPRKSCQKILLKLRKLPISISKCVYKFPGSDVFCG